MTKISLISLLILLMFTASIAYSKNIHVDCNNTEGPWDGTPEHPYQYIQDGIDAASDSDTVLVADCTYKGNRNKNLDFKGKAITVTSENGAENCIIDCENSGRGFYFHSDETSSSVVSGFTIRNGRRNRSDGAGIYCYYSSPTITNNIIINNYALDGHGGGIACYYSSPIIINNVIKNNKSDFNGGGIDCNHSSPTITNNVIENNNSNSGGGGISFNLYSSPNGESQIANNIIIKNKVGSYDQGGGIQCFDHSNPQIINNIIADNEASYTTGFGGGIYCEALYFPLKICNNLIIGNKAKYGGGIRCYFNASPIITNNTISGNSAGSSYSGGGIDCERNVSPIILNSILWGNTPQEIELDNATITVTYSNIKGGWPGEGNIDADPLFVGPENGIYYLQTGSPCLGSAKCDGAPETDKDGQPRPLGSGCDMGCYEECNNGIFGYISSDCDISAYDASLALQFVVGLTELSERQQIAADVTGNGNVTALDAALILQYTVGLIIEFPVQQAAPILTHKYENQILTQIIAELEDIPLTAEQKHVLEQLKRFIGQQPLPSSTKVLQNYPNPFNPETWLPYQLAQDTPVIIRIYNIKGRFVRRINLGTQPAGIYLSKDRAAYWDGKDNLGQLVASGVYFYTLEAGSFTATRRMLIVK